MTATPPPATQASGASGASGVGSLPNRSLVDGANERYVAFLSGSATDFDPYVREIIVRFTSAKPSLCVNDEALWGRADNPKPVWHAVKGLLIEWLIVQRRYPLPPLPVYPDAGKGCPRD
jgi:hypothetical protein